MKNDQGLLTIRLSAIMPFHVFFDGLCSFRTCVEAPARARLDTPITQRLKPGGCRGSRVCACALLQARVRIRMRICALFIEAGGLGIQVPGSGIAGTRKQQLFGKARVACTLCKKACSGTRGAGISQSA